MISNMICNFARRSVTLLMICSNIAVDDRRHRYPLDRSLSSLPLLFVVIWGVGWWSTFDRPLERMGHPRVVRLGRKLSVVEVRSLAPGRCRLVLLLLLLDCLASDGVVVSENPLALRRSLRMQDDETGRQVTWQDDAIVIVWFFEGVAELPTEADHQKDDEEDA